MIVGIANLRNEVGIVETVIRHHFGQGIDRIIVYDAMSTDGTRDVLHKLGKEWGHRLRIYDDDSPFYVQEDRINELVGFASELGADWIIPFDADEFVYPVTGGTIGGALRLLDQVASYVKRIRMEVWNHTDWNRREAARGTIAQALTHSQAPVLTYKMAFRWEPGARLGIGQHGVSTSGIDVDGVLAVREWKYRNYEHFCHKIEGALETMRPNMASDVGSHVQQFRGASECDMMLAWDAMAAVETVRDPIPSPLTSLA